MNDAPFAGPGEVLPPRHRETLRQRLGRELFTDARLDALSHLLDDRFAIPGTPIRFGLDGIVGLVPFAGDAIGGLLSSVIVVAGWFRGLPAATLVRMLVNLAIDVFIGTVPLLGDAFDIAWKANRRNYALLTRHLSEPGRHTWRDWIFLLLLCVALVAIFVLPLVALGWLLARLTH